MLFTPRHAIALALVALLCCQARADLTPIGTGGNFSTNFDRAIATPDGSQILIAGRGTILPSPPDAEPGVFSMPVASSQASRFWSLAADAEIPVEFLPPTGDMRVSRDGRRVVIAMDARHVGMGDGGQTIWMFDRQQPAGRLVTRRPDGDFSADFQFDSSIDSLDATGRYVTFSSNASDLVPGDANGRIDVFLYDLDLRTVRRVSVSSTGAELPAGGILSSISPDGQRIVFATMSVAVPADANSYWDWYVYEVATGAVSLLSKGPGGAVSTGAYPYDQARWSDDGRYIAFTYNDRQSFEIDGYRAYKVVYDRTSDSLMSLARFIDAPINQDTSSADVAQVLRISQSGRYVLLNALQLVPTPYPGVPSPYGGLYLHDRQIQQSVRVDMLPDGTLPSLRWSDEQLIGDSARVFFRNGSPELGVDPEVIFYDWRPPTPSNLKVTVDGPRNSIDRNTPARYVIHVTNLGSTTLNDVVVRRYHTRGVPTGMQEMACYYDCSLPPLAPGVTANLTFDISAQPAIDDGTFRIQMDIRAQSVSRFDQSPNDNRVTISAAESSSGGGGGGGGGNSGGGGGGGGPIDTVAVMLLAGLAAARRRGHSGETVPFSRNGV